MRTTTLTLLLAAALALASCGRTTPAAEPTAPAAPPTMAPSAAPAETPAPAAAPTELPTPTAAPTETPAPAAASTAEPTALAELAATAVAGLPPTPTAADSQGDGPGISAVATLALSGPGAGLAVVFSTGMHSYDPPQQHFVAIARRGAAGWEEIARATLESPDYLDPSGVQQVQITPDQVWLSVEGGVGAHGGCFSVLRFDGAQLKVMVESCAASPGAGGIADIDGDGTPEVVLDQTDAYVTCYACGLRLYKSSALRWDGSDFRELALADLPGNDALATLNNRAVALARAARWKEALPLAAQLREQGKGNQIALTNAGLIELDGKPLEEQAADGPSPVMDKLFFGDYDGVIALLRERPAADLFDPETSQIFGEVAQGFESAMPGYITTTTELALAQDPSFAPARFLHGWALALATPGDPRGLQEIEAAAALTPDEPLYRSAAAYVRKR